MQNQFMAATRRVVSPGDVSIYVIEEDLLEVTSTSMGKIRSWLSGLWFVFIRMKAV